MPLFDFSSALPWVGSGFIVGLLVSWLLRKLSGVDARRLKEIEALTATVDDAKRAHASLTSANSQLEAERARLTAEINQISPRASLVPQLERQTADLKQALTQAQKDLDTSQKQLASLHEQATAQLATLRQDAEVKGSTAKYYEEEYGRLHSAHQALTNDWTSASGLVSKLQADYAVASREAQEAVRLRSEIASARAQAESLRADLEALRQSGQVELARANHDANARMLTVQQALSARETQIASLNDELAKLKSTMASAPKEDLSGEVSRLNGLLDTLQKDYRNSESVRLSLTQEVKRLEEKLSLAAKNDHSGDVQRLTAEVERFRSDTARINGEVARLTEALEDTRNKERSASMDLHAARTDLGQVRTALEETTRLLGERHSEVEQLRSRLAAMPDVESYRRFKDALDAANRIAAGLPEKG